MTPKEKANQLADKYFDLNWEWDGVTKYDWAKEGALIAVDEILNVLSEYTIEPFVFDIEYWKEVKSEIINL
jgi:hypothetical protein